MDEYVLPQALHKGHALDSHTLQHRCHRTRAIRRTDRRRSTVSVSRLGHDGDDAKVATQPSTSQYGTLSVEVATDARILSSR